MLADNALTTLDRMKLMLGLADIEDERTDEIMTTLRPEKSGSSTETRDG